MPTTTPPITPTTDSYPDPDVTDTTDKPEPTDPATAQPVDPNKDACKLDKFDTITVIDGELHFFNDGWGNQSIFLCEKKSKNKAC